MIKENSNVLYEMSAGERMMKQYEEEVNFETKFCQAIALCMGWFLCVYFLQQKSF